MIAYVLEEQTYDYTNDKPNYKILGVYSSVSKLIEAKDRFKAKEPIMFEQGHKKFREHGFLVDDDMKVDVNYY